MTKNVTLLYCYLCPLFTNCTSMHLAWKVTILFLSALGDCASTEHAKSLPILTARI